jgi:hypothetical protein
LVGGSGYVLDKTQITVSGPGGSSVVITPTITTKAISALTITSAGKGFLNTPTIYIISGITGTTSITAGSGYNDGIYNLGVSGGVDSGCTGSFTISSGGLTSITKINAGTGYTSAPALSFPLASPGSSAAATATLGSGASATAVNGSGAVASVSGIYTNSKRMRFGLNNSPNDLKLSQNVRCVVETCNIPSITNLAGKCMLLRIVTSTQDKICDTKKILNGNPILVSMATQSTVGATNVLYNKSEFFYNINVPTNIFSQGYIDIELDSYSLLECPSLTENIDFIMSKLLSTFFTNLIVVDQDPSLTSNLTLAPPIDYNN